MYCAKLFNFVHCKNNQIYIFLYCNIFFLLAIIFAICAQDYDDIGGEFQWKIDLTNLKHGQCVESPELALNNLMWILKYCESESNYGQVFLQAIPNDNIPHWTCQVEASIKIRSLETSIENATFSNVEFEKASSGYLGFRKKTDDKFDFTLSIGYASTAINSRGFRFECRYSTDWSKTVYPIEYH